MIKLFNKRLFFIIFLIFYYLNSGNKLEREDTPLYSIDLSKNLQRLLIIKQKSILNIISVLYYCLNLIVLKRS
ncbi:Uncharacterised protein [Pasteurella multocida]|nr:Uncharacterised protein [Pasteurella multocida]